MVDAQNSLTTAETAREDGTVRYQLALTNLQLLARSNLSMIVPSSVPTTDRLECPTSRLRFSPRVWMPLAFIFTRF